MGRKDGYSFSDGVVFRISNSEFTQSNISLHEDITLRHWSMFFYRDIRITFQLY